MVTVLNELKAEAATMSPPDEQPQAAKAAGGRVESPDMSLSLVPVITPAVGLVATMVTTRYQVAALEAQEKAALAAAICRLAEAYKLRIQDEKVAAWLGVGATAAAIIMPRVKLPEQAAPPKPEPEQETAVAA